ncbi:proton-dependent oligopeptide transporter family protein [Tanacetum coccineum]
MYDAGVEVAERFAYYGVSSNLITYLTGSLGLSTATAAENVNAWTGTASLLPLVGAFIADAFLGRYSTIIFASLLYILLMLFFNYLLSRMHGNSAEMPYDVSETRGNARETSPRKGETFLKLWYADPYRGNALGLLALSTLLPTDCESVVGDSSCSPHLQAILFFVSLYLVAFAQGGHKPCVQAFGADQFDANDPDECRAKSSFFNWWYFGMCAGPTVGIFVLSYIQDNLSWALGFGIPCIVMGFALIVFLLGTRTYRFLEKTEEKSAFARIGHVFAEAARNRKITHSALSVEEQACGTSHHQASQQFRFLDKALLSPDASVCSSSEVEEAKSVLTCSNMGQLFEIPAATLQSFIGLSIIILIPIYDVMLVPLIRPITKIPSGITMLQRIGTGIFLSIVLMAVAALVETKRLKIAHEYGLIDDPNATVPMKIWWLLPQYLLAGAAEVFTVVGMQEFFYDQVPIELRSIGLALYLSVMGSGNFLSSFLISIVEKTTGRNGEDGWISDNVNRGHIDYFYYLLAGISAGAFVIYIYAAKSYVYNRVKAL